MATTTYEATRTWTGDRLHLRRAGQDTTLCGTRSIGCVVSGDLQDVYRHATCRKCRKAAPAYRVDVGAMVREAHTLAEARSAALDMLVVAPSYDALICDRLHGKRGTLLQLVDGRLQRVAA